MRGLRFAVGICGAASVWYAWHVCSDATGWPIVEPPRPGADLPPISIIVPARNEARNIERCVRSLLAQRHPRCEVIAVDDRSTDETGAILARLQAEHPELTVVSGADLPTGWVGKPWAIWQGARRAGGAWLLFTDADAVHEPDASAAVQQFALDRGVDAVSIATRQELGSFWERAVLPSILGMVVVASGKSRDLNDPAKPENALANGQYLMVTREAYDALGGHEALRAQIAEDIEFARRLKNDGRFRMLLANGTAFVRVRMYHSLREIWDGFTKNLYIGAHGQPVKLAGGLALLSALSFGPPLLTLVAALRGKGRLALAALAAGALNVTATGWALGRAGVPRRYGLYQPIGMAVLAAITANSWWRVASGRGVAWRGRRYTGRYQGDAP